MSLEAPVPSRPFSLPEKPWKRVLYGLAVIIPPGLCFWGVDLLKLGWQSGSLHSYVAILLSPAASLLFFPLLTYSVISYLLLLISADRFASSRIIRFGVYSGFLLATQYFVLSILYTEPSGLFYLIPIWIGSLAVLWLYRWIQTRWGQVSALQVIFGLLALALICGLLPTQQGLYLVLLFLALSAPFWSLLLAGGTAVWLFRNFDQSKLDWKWVPGFVAWLAAYGVAWRYDVLKMFELYAALPTRPPDCYIATAAANGHPRLVRSQAVDLANGKSMRVNQQLQRFKCTELVLLALAPRVHAPLRKWYDVLGRWLARRMNNPYAADVAYLLLKPAEWLSFMALSVFFPETMMIVSRLYRG